MDVNVVVVPDDSGIETQDDMSIPDPFNKKNGRKGKQQRLSELGDDPKVSSSIRGWIKNEKRHIRNGNRKTIRNPRNSRNCEKRGTESAHPRGQRAKMDIVIKTLNFKMQIYTNLNINMADIDKKIENILKMSEDERYDCFIRKVTDFEKIWGLNNDGWALLGDNDGNQILPLWPEKEFAELCAVDQWKGHKAEAIELENFIRKWVPGMTNDKTLINVFLTPNNKGTVISPIDLNSDLQDELEDYE